MYKENKLSDEDQARVDSYLNRPNHQVNRAPFRPWLLLGAVLVILTVLSFISYALAWWHGVV